MTSRLTPRMIKASSRTLAAIPLAALAVVGSITAARHDRVGHTAPVAAPRATASATPAPEPLAPIAVAPVAQDAATGGNGDARTAVNVATTSSDIPAVALAAYQRAAATIDIASPTCHLDWSLLAAVGKVESNHGNGQFDAQGAATHAIVGPALTGEHGTSLVPDSDGGVYDGDATYDHAVGPMQILPATWASVGVDADADGQRNPQDIDDAALAAAVFLCSGGGDLSTSDGQNAAALRYNPALWYAASVVAIAHAYATSAPMGAAVSAVFIPARTAAPAEVVPLTPVKHHQHHTAGTANGPADEPTSAPTSAPTQTPISTPTSPSMPETDLTTSTPSTTDTAPAAPSPPSTPSTPAAPSTPPAATTDQLTQMCSAAIAKAYPDAAADVQQQATDACVTKLTGKTPDDAQAALPDIVTSLPQNYPALQPAPAVEPLGNPAAG